MTPNRALEITVGAGRTRPQGDLLLASGPDPVLALQHALNDLPSWQEQWWCGSTFRADYRKESNWQRSDLVGVDLDYRDDAGNHAAVPAEFKDRLSPRLPFLPGNVAHRTPRGYRVLFVLDRPVHDVATWRRAARGAASLVSSSLVAHRLGAGTCPGRKAGLSVDQGASTDPARLWWAPRAVVDGKRRDADVLVLEEHLYRVEMLAMVGRTPTEPSRPARERRRADGASRYGLAVLRQACERIAGAIEGVRHQTLKRRGRLVAGYAAGGEIEEQFAFACLLDAAMDAGLPEPEARSLLTWAFKHGKERPLAAPPRGSSR